MWHSDDLETRTKIVGPAAASLVTQQGRTAVVSGYFDPLLVEHARRLREIRMGFDTLLVVLLDPPDPILTAVARAELVAALEMVDYVVLPVEAEWPGLVFREKSTHRMHFEHLVEYVQRRHALPVSSD